MHVTPLAEIETWSAFSLPEEDVFCPGSLEGLSPALVERFAKKQTLGMHLTDLQEEPPKCVFIVRRVSCMGFQSQELLLQHYSQYGIVKRVLVAHSKVKPVRQSGATPRIRPGGLGFIVMESPAAVKTILAIGKEQLVVGCHICVEPFEQTVKSKEDSGSLSVSTTEGSGSNSSEKDSGSGIGSTSSEKGSQSDGSQTKKEARMHGQGKVEGSSTDSQFAESSESGSGNEAVSPGVKQDSK